MDVGRPTLDQLAIFLAVLEEGSFHAAAKRLGRAVSAVSYGISALEAQLGVTLFAREGSRRPELTAAGKAILAHARAIGDEVDEMVAGLRDFQMAFPTVDLRLHVDGLGAVVGLVLDGRAQLAVAGPVAQGQPLLDMVALGGVELVPVASPGHALARMETIAPGTSRQYRQLVLTDRSPLTEGQDFGVLGARNWRLGDLAAKHALLLEGIGWGNMPRHMVADDLAAGRLVMLALPEGRSASYPLFAAWRKDCRPGPARSWMLEALAARLTA